MATPPSLADLPVRERYQAPPWIVVVRSDLGLVRTRLEDAWAVLPAASMRTQRVHAFAVFDGLGGLPHGQEAAWTAAEQLPDALARAGAVEHVLGQLNAAVERTRGATTAVVALFPADSAAGQGTILSAGDSGAYMLDTSGGARLLTPKDSEGPYTVTDYLGHTGLRGHATPVAVPHGGALLLCSDGVDGVVEPSSLARVLKAPDLGAAVDELFFEILDRGAPDNATVVVARRIA